MADKNTAEIGFEKQIWDAACVLRGNLDASEYKSVVLGLIFLKYISDRFDEKYKELMEEGDGFEEDVDEYTSEGIFFVPAIINTFLEAYDFSNKTITLFATSGSSGLGNTVNELKVSAPNALIKEGLLLNNLTTQKVKELLAL